jgi:hypothetical protein
MNIESITLGDSRIEFDHEDAERVFFRIKTLEWEHLDSVGKPKCGEATIRDSLSAFLGFLTAAGDAYKRVTMQRGFSDNSGMFPPHVNEWAYQNSEELAMMKLEIDEGAQPAETTGPLIPGMVSEFTCQELIASLNRKVMGLERRLRALENRPDDRGGCNE